MARDAVTIQNRLDFSFEVESSGGAVWAEKQFGRLLEERSFENTAVFRTNVWTAPGITKAMGRHGVRVGKAISVCTVNDGMLAPWLSPTLTSLRLPDAGPMSAKCVKWMVSGGNWVIFRDFY